MGAGLIEHNPALKKPILVMLATVARMPDENRADIEQAAQQAWSDGFRQSPQAIVDVLVRNAAVEETVLVNGEPYAGTVEDIQLDRTVDEAAIVESSLYITDEGCAILDEYASEHTLNALYAERPQYTPVFDAALSACAQGEGCDRAALEDAINRTLESHPDARAKDDEGRQRVYAQYFMDALETAGGIEWHGSWQATQAGRAAIAE